MTNKLSQKNVCLELLKDNTEEWLPAHYFVGEKATNGQWYYLPYSTPKRLSDLHKEGLVDRQLVKGRSGATYYSYKLK